jgi:hypothetical protein
VAVEAVGPARKDVADAAGHWLNLNPMDHVGREVRRQFDLAARPSARNRAGTEHPLLGLQRAAGNRALSETIAGVARETGDGALDPTLQLTMASVGTAVAAAPEPPPDGTGRVQRKLEGTADALVSQTGGKNSGVLRKAFGKRTRWDRIIRGVQAYEALEKRALVNGSPSPEDLQHMKEPLIEQLQRIETDCVKWQRDNPDGGKSERWHEQARAGGELQERDTRSKARRRQAIAMLLPRVRTEIQDLNSGRWAEGMGLNPAKLTGEGAEDRGQVNVVKELFYETEHGEFSGWFKAEKGFSPEPQGREIKRGIHQADPNYSARSVAMYRLDQLFNANVTAKVEFAIHNGQMGTVIEGVGGEKGTTKGTRAGDARWAMGSRDQSEGSIDATDPLLQQCLNKLQILDAICGQLDRHDGNWFVQTDTATGKVTGVKGIDLDMAFGANMLTTAQGQDRETDTGQAYLGMTEQVDREFGLALIQIQEADIENTLRGLLSDSEIAATLSRFRSVKTKIQEMAAAGTLTGSWDDTTFDRDRTKEQTHRMEGHATYTGRVAGHGANAALTEIMRFCQGYFTNDRGEPPPGFDVGLKERLPQGMWDVVRLVLWRNLAGARYVQRKIWSGVWPPHKAYQIVMTLANGMVGDGSLVEQLRVAKEDGEAKGEPWWNQLGPTVEAWVDRKSPEVLERLGVPPVQN